MTTHVQYRPYIGLAQPRVAGLGAAAGSGELESYSVATLGIVGSLGGGLWGGLIGAGVGQSHKSTAVGAAIGATVGLIGGLFAGFRVKGAVDAARSSQNTPSPT
jgi:hypothetical protein